MEQIVAYLLTIERAEARATELSHLRQFYKWAQRHGRRLDEPTALIPRPKLPRRLPRPIHEDDLSMALELAPDRERSWLLLAGWAGLRCCEIAGLRAEHFGGGVLLIEESKGGDVETVPLSTWLRAQLATCNLPRSGWLYLTRDGTNRRMPAHLLSQHGNAYLRSVGVDATMHQLRHRFGTVAHEVTGDLRKTQELLRHRTPVSTQLYTHVNPKHLAAVVEELPVPIPSTALRATA